MPQKPSPHRVAVVALDGVVPFDLSTPGLVLGAVRLARDRPAYRVRVCGVAREVDAGGFRLKLKYGLAEALEADTLLVPGIADITRAAPPSLVRALRRASDLGIRIVSICTGAFVLAAAGVLDGRRATTHWLAAPDLARRFPRVVVDPNVLFVDSGTVLTSAGASAGIDLCLHLVRKDYGAAAAAAASRIAVMPLEREGGQAQFIAHTAPTSDEVPLSRLLGWMQARLGDEALSLEAMARHAAMSVRTLTRRFKEQLGTTPLQWLLRARIRRAQVLLETSRVSVERVADSVGFGSVATMRVHFRRHVGTTPQAYRRAFQGRSA